MDYYGTLVDADLYNAQRGRSGWAEFSDEERIAALVRGSDYVDWRYRRTGDGCASSFPGVKTGGRSQDREWPRTGAVDRNGDPIPSDEVPVEVIRATFEAAYREALEPGSLSPDYVPSQLVTREKVGPIEVSYSDPSKLGSNPNSPVVTVIDEILAPILFKRYCGSGVFVV